MTDKKLHQADKLRNEKNKSEDDKPKNGVSENFADDVTVQDAHGANRECSTAAAAFTCGASRTAQPWVRGPRCLFHNVHTDRDPCAHTGSFAGKPLELGLAGAISISVDYVVVFLKAVFL